MIISIIHISRCLSVSTTGQASSSSLHPTDLCSLLCLMLTYQLMLINSVSYLIIYMHSCLFIRAFKHFETLLSVECVSWCFNGVRMQEPHRQDFDSRYLITTIHAVGFSKKKTCDIRSVRKSHLANKVVTSFRQIDSIYSVC